MKKTKSELRHCFIGVSLAGGKTDKASIAVIEYYADAKRIFLSRLFEKIKSDEELSADLKIHETIMQYKDEAEYVAFDTPWNFPLCLTCQLVCPGYEQCKEESIQWMWKLDKAKNKSKKPKKLFTPYTQRPVEMYINQMIEEPMNIQPVMGANTAPLMARAAFISRRLNLPLMEVFPPLSIWRIGQSLGMLKSRLRSTRKSADGQQARKSFLNELSEKEIVFIYEQDKKHMIENNHAFEAFICGLTAYLKFKGQTEPRPAGFPKHEAWIDFPIVKTKF